MGHGGDAGVHRGWRHSVHSGTHVHSPTRVRAAPGAVPGRAQAQIPTPRALSGKIPRLAGGALQAGDVIDGRYRIESMLGEGGMASAYRVVDDSTGRRVALKRLRKKDNQASIPDRNRLRMRHEFHTVARLQHPCVVEVDTVSVR